MLLFCSPHKINAMDDECYSSQLVKVGFYLDGFALTNFTSESLMINMYMWFECV